MDLYERYAWLVLDDSSGEPQTPSIERREQFLRWRLPDFVTTYGPAYFPHITLREAQVRGMSGGELSHLYQVIGQHLRPQPLVADDLGDVIGHRQSVRRLPSLPQEKCSTNPRDILASHDFAA